MSDEYLGGSPTPVEPGQEQPQSPEDAEGEQPKPITKADLESFSKALRKDLLDVIRSQTIQSESKIKKEVDAKLTQVENNFKQLKEAGYPVSEDDLKQARSQAISEALKSLQTADEEARPQRGAAPDPKEQAVIEETNAKLHALQKRYDYVIADSDPEFYEIQWGGLSPDDFLSQYERLLREVAPRRGRQLPAEEQIVNPAARAPSPVGGTVGSNMDALTLELGQLQNKANRSPAEERRRKEIEVEMMKYLPKR